MIYRDEPHTRPDARIIVDRLCTITLNTAGIDRIHTGSTYVEETDEGVPSGAYDTPEPCIPGLTNLVEYKYWFHQDMGIGYTRHNDVNDRYHPNAIDDHFGYYTTYLSQMPDLTYNRFLFGLYAFATEADAITAYAMFHTYNDPYDDFDAAYDGVYPASAPDYLLVRPTRSGEPVYSLGGIEAIREGVKDARYIATLQTLIAAAPNDPCAVLAKSYLDDVKSRIDTDYFGAYWNEAGELGYYEAILADLTDPGDPQTNDYEAFSEIRRTIADYIKWLK